MQPRINTLTNDRFYCILMALDSVKDQVYIINSTNKVDFINSAAQKALDISELELGTISITEIEKRGLDINPIINLVRKNGRKEILIRQTASGRRLLIEGMPHQFEDENKIIVLAHDITQIDELQSRLEMKDKMEKRYKQELWGLRQTLLQREPVVYSKIMKQIMEVVTQIAQVDSTVLLMGESGVGKGILAKSIHDLSRRYMGPFIKIDCGSFPESLIESELFGYVAGAFTGALKDGKAGMIDMANSGTLFLDEIGELSMPMQVKLLQVLQEHRYRRVGGTKAIDLDARIITATNRDLQKMISEGKFRQDLFYRLNVVPIRIPPLRERPEDIPKLVEHFLYLLKGAYGKEKGISNGVMEVFLNYSWPGNIRELENMVERLFVTARGSMIETKDLPEGFRKKEASLSVNAMPNIIESNNEKISNADIVVNTIVPLKKATERLEAELVRMAYEKYKSTTKVGKALGIDQSTAVRKIQKYLQPYAE